MSVREQKTAEEVVTKWKTTWTLVCDGCGAEHVVNSWTSNRTGWVVLKAVEEPAWYDTERVSAEVKHFCALACLQRWSVQTRYLWDRLPEEVTA